MCSEISIIQYDPRILERIRKTLEQTPCSSEDNNTTESDFSDQPNKSEIVENTNDLPCESVDEDTESVASVATPGNDEGNSNERCIGSTPCLECKHCYSLIPTAEEKIDVLIPQLLEILKDRLKNENPECGFILWVLPMPIKIRKYLENSGYYVSQVSSRLNEITWVKKQK